MCDFESHAAAVLFDFIVQQSVVYVNIKFTISFKGSGYTVTKEDRYEFEGFTYDHGTNIGESCNGAEFYYKRNIYNLEFYSASKNQADNAFWGQKPQTAVQ